MRYAYRDRRKKKVTSAASGSPASTRLRAINGISYSRLIAGLAKAGVEVDRKILADLAVHDERPSRRSPSWPRASRRDRAMPGSSGPGDVPTLAELEARLAAVPGLDGPALEAETIAVLGRKSGALTAILKLIPTLAVEDGAASARP
jgi:hypothetical protein